mgnify:CR=1 FL=1
MIAIKTFEVNLIQENCYIVSDDTNEAVIVDCGAFYQEELTAISEYIECNGLKPVAHILTHAHFDHVWGAGYIYNRYRLPARMHPADLAMFLHAEAQPPMYMRFKDFHRDFGAAGELLSETTTIDFGHHSFTVIATPGHTPGGVCFHCPDERVLFSGDSLFAQSIGRTDFPGGSYDQLVSSLRRMMTAIPDDTTIYPGHGPVTTAVQERLCNPYLS